MLVNLHRASAAPAMRTLCRGAIKNANAVVSVDGVAMLLR
jgi:hypothetical protein